MPRIALPLFALLAAVSVTGGREPAEPLFPERIDVNVPSITSDKSILRGVTLTGGVSGPDVQLDGSHGVLDGVGVQSAPATAILVHGTDATLSGPVVSAPHDNGIVVSGARAVITNPDVSGAGGDGISIGGDASATQISGGTSHGNAGAGIAIDQQGVRVSRVVIYGNGGRPIALAGGANGGIVAPQGLRIGPRQADGSLPLTGTTPTGGGIELWSGDPFGPLAPSFYDVFGISPGGFSYRFASEPPPGATFALTVTADGTSEFSTVTVPADVISPEVVKARALSTTDVRVVPSEPLDPNSVQPQDFALTMAGKDRQITAATAAPDGSFVDLTSSGWKAGEAGYVQLTAAGALTDVAGNASLNTTRLRVAAAPGDFIAPIAGSLELRPSNICLTHGHGCRSPGTTIHFVTTETGKALLVVQRGNKRVGTRLYGAVDAGANALRFNGRLSGRKLRAGRYRVLIYVQDQVGNVTDQPPIALMRVRRVTG